MRSQRPQAQTIRKTGGKEGGFKKFLLCNLFWFRRVCMFFFLIISFLFLAYFFSAVPAASYYFTPFCFCLFVYFCMGLFCLGISLSASFFLWCPIVAGVGSVAKVTAQPGSNSSWYVPCIIYKVLVLTKVERMGDYMAYWHEVYTNHEITGWTVRQCTVFQVKSNSLEFGSISFKPN